METFMIPFLPESFYNDDANQLNITKKIYILFVATICVVTFLCYISTTIKIE